MERAENKDLERRIWHLTDSLRKGIAKKRKEELLLPQNSSSNNYLKLDFLEVDKNGLVEIKNFSPFMHGLLYEDFVFQLCPSLSNFNSSYWLFDLILQEAYRNNINFKIRLDPFIRCKNVRFF